MVGVARCAPVFREGGAELAVELVSAKLVDKSFLSLGIKRAAIRCKAVY